MVTRRLAGYSREGERNAVCCSLEWLCQKSSSDPRWDRGSISFHQGQIPKSLGAEADHVPEQNQEAKNRAKGHRPWAQVYQAQVTGRGVADAAQHCGKPAPTVSKSMKSRVRGGWGDKVGGGGRPPAPQGGRRHRGTERGPRVGRVEGQPLCGLVTAGEAAASRGQKLC